MKDDFISRQKAKEAVLKHNGIMFIPDKKFVAEALASVPAADVVEVVRCKDCIYARNMPFGLCYLHTEPCISERGYKGEAVCVEPDDFCSYGKKCV